MDELNIYESNLISLIIHFPSFLLMTFPEASLWTLAGGALIFLSSLDLTLTILA